MRAHPWTVYVIDCNRRPSTVMWAMLALCALSIIVHAVGDVLAPPTVLEAGASVHPGAGRFADPRLHP